MKQHELTPGVTSHLISYSSATIDCLEKRFANSNAYIHGNVCKGGHVAWLSRGSSLEVTSTAHGERVAAWNFGAAVGDQSCNITCVSEYKYGESLTLLVGIETATQAGMLCVFDIKKSKVVAAIEVSITQKITAIEPIHNSLACHVPVHLFCDHLRHFSGIVAIGTQGGHIFIIDMCLDDIRESSDEIKPSQLSFVNPQTYDISRKRLEVCRRGEHLCFRFDYENFVNGLFLFKKPDHNVIQKFNADEVSVTCLKYVKQSGCLCAGFNFGCFQIWRLSTPRLEYSSRYDVDIAPVTHFAYQEPENDPRNFCYLWVARGSLSSDSMEEWISSVQLYQLVYDRKSWSDQFGVFYEDIVSVGQRFDHILHGSHAETTCSRVLSCFTLEDPYGSHENKALEDDSFDEAIHNSDLSLCVFAWEAMGDDGDDGDSRSSCHLVLFDMNRWYHAQMPSSMRFFGSGQEQCPFFAFYTLSSIMETCAPDCLLSAVVGPETVTKFNSTIIPVPEHHLYPSSLAFNVCCLTETGVVHSKFLGIQRQFLNNVNQQGPIALTDPTDCFNYALYAGLLPRNMDHVTSASLTVPQLREVILSLVLEHGLINFITTCCQQWSNPEYVHAGCNLRFLLDWAWNRVAHIKDNVDKLCTPFYDWSCVQPDRQALLQLQHYQLQLSHMITLFHYLSSQSAPTTAQGLQDLDAKLKVVTLINQHIQIVLWFVNAGLLPEYPEGQSSTNQFGYPDKSLIQAYVSRRNEIKSLHSTIKENDLLLIDGLTEHGGSALFNLWSKTGGGGHYPPPSLYALLNIYLLEGISLTKKHAIVTYLLLDLVSLSDDEQFAEKLGKFCQSFCVGQHMPRMIQAFWLLDHKDFEESMLMFLDPMIDIQLSPWQHNRILKSFLYHGQSKQALKYMRIKKPLLHSPEDVKLTLTILLANKLTSEAFEYQRAYRNQTSLQDLLSHFYTGCQQTKTVDALLQLPLNDTEEKYFIQHLQNSSESHSLEVLVMHYLQRARYVEALRWNEKLKNNLMSEKDPKARERAAARSAIIECYASILPAVQRKLTFRSDHQLRKRAQFFRREVHRPKPLSTVVNRSKKSQAISHATLIQSVFEKVYEARAQDLESEDIETPQKNAATSTQPGPFTCTPITPKTRTRISDVVDVVYPSVIKEETLEPRETAPSLSIQSPLKRPIVSVGAQEVARKLVGKGISALSLLDTPPIKRKSPTRQQQDVVSQPTPQSILKVRKAVRKSISPSPDVRIRPLQLDIDLSTPPKYQGKKIGFAEPSENSDRSTKPSTSNESAQSSRVSLIAGQGDTSSTRRSQRVAFLEPDKPQRPQQVSFMDVHEDESPAPRSQHVSFVGARPQVSNTPKNLRFMLPEDKNEQQLKSTVDLDSLSSCGSDSALSEDENVSRRKLDLETKEMYSDDEDICVDEEITFHIHNEQPDTVEAMETGNNDTEPIVEACNSDSSAAVKESSITVETSSDSYVNQQEDISALVISVSSDSKTSVSSEAESPERSQEILEKTSPLRIDTSTNVADEVASQRSRRSPRKKATPSPPRSLKKEAISSPQKSPSDMTHSKSPVRQSSEKNDVIDESEANYAAADNDNVFKTPPHPSRLLLTMTPPTSPESTQVSPAQVVRRSSPRRTPTTSQQSPSKVSPHTSPKTKLSSTKQSHLRTVTTHLALEKHKITIGDKGKQDSMMPEEITQLSTRNLRSSSVDETPAADKTENEMGKSPSRKGRSAKKLEADSKSGIGASKTPNKNTPTRKSKKAGAETAVVDSEIINSPSRITRQSKQSDKAETENIEIILKKSPGRKAKTSNNNSGAGDTEKAPGTHKKSPGRKPKIVNSKNESGDIEEVTKTLEKSPGYKPKVVSEVKTSKKSPSRKSKTADKSTVSENVELTSIKKFSPSRQSTRLQKQTELNLEEMTPVARKILTAKKTIDTRSSAKQEDEMFGASSVSKGSTSKSMIKKSPGRKKKTRQEEPVDDVAEDNDVFTFSDPMVVNAEPIEEELLQEAASQTFIFSPPITIRSNSTSEDPGIDHSIISTTRKTIRKARSTSYQSAKMTTRSHRTESDMYAPSDSPINFISPVADEASTSRPVRQRVKRIPLHSMSLRGVAGGKKKRIAKLY